MHKLSALEIGNLVNTKQVSPVEVIEHFADRIEAHNDKINAFTYTKIDYALEEAKKLEERIVAGEIAYPHIQRPFAGVPFALKDFLPSKKGWSATHGGVACYQTVDNETGVFTEAIERLGGIAIGKTNAPSFGFRATTDNKMYGPTSTPFKIGYNSGGSSGGSCAAVGSQLVPLAECGDAGGSIRVPASWCGVFGYKASAGVIPNVCRPDAWTATHPYCTPGPATKTVADAEMIFNAMCRYNPRDPLSVPYDYLHERELSSTAYHLRIGFTFDFDLFPYPDSEIADAIEEISNLLRGHVKSVKPVQFHFKHFREEMEEAWLSGISIDDAMNTRVRALIKSHPEDFPDAVIKWTDIARNSLMEDYINFHNVRTDILDAHLEVFEHCDIILAPVTGCLPVKNGTDGDTQGPKVISGEKVDPLIGFAYTYLENMTGMPAASVPIGLSQEGLPIGIQVIAPRYKDADVFRICKIIERIHPWRQLYDEVRF